MDTRCNIGLRIISVFKKILEMVKRKEILIFSVEICIIFAYIITCKLVTYYHYVNDSQFGFNNNDYYISQGIELWNEYGCSVFFKDKQTEVFDELQRIISDSNLVDSIKVDTRILNYFDRYSEEEIESAINAFVYGCNNPKHSSGDYKSINDVPEKLMRCCNYEIVQHSDMHLGYVSRQKSIIKFRKERNGMKNNTKGFVAVLVDCVAEFITWLWGFYYL
ncbi:MAG: hypothetical protein K6G87_18480 [Butyrivibrio sp.]|uniref:hypothetical protein n=1 Tax=Butyrivibrio sp. TaxID=28121 RepID=UPI0025E0D06D|nr:hypothetical protein [Butyrivibrio sp.]MCR5773213.1 hypothetical protein [Butyrivibrio sp.]